MAWFPTLLRRLGLMDPAPADRPVTAPAKPLGGPAEEMVWYLPATAQTRPDLPPGYPAQLSLTPVPSWIEITRADYEALRQRLNYGRKD